MYNTIEDLCRTAEERNQPMWMEILEDEMRCTDKCEDDVWKELENRYDIMKNGTTAALGESGKRLRKTMITGMAERQFSYAENGNSLCGVGINKMMARAISLSETNAAMGKICAAPTAGSCGILPAVLVTMEEEWNLSKRKILEGLLIASGIGAVVVKCHCCRSGGRMSGRMWSGGCYGSCSRSVSGRRNLQTAGSSGVIGID